MSVDAWFSAANQLALAGWLSLVLGLAAGALARTFGVAAAVAKYALLLGGRLIPILLALGYAVSLSQWFGEAKGGFGSLMEVESLFQTRGMVLAGWLHFLCFDLLIGRWQIDKLDVLLTTGSRQPHGWIWRLALVPCLVATFLFGPVGLLSFAGLLLLHRMARSKPSVT